MRFSVPRPKAAHLALALSGLALFISLGGVSYAAKAVNGKLLKRGTVTGAKIKNGSIGTSDLGRNAVRGPNANASGTRVANFGTIAQGDCAFVEVKGISSRSGDISEDALLLSPDGAVDSTASFSMYATPNGAGDFNIGACNVGGPGPLDPDGPGGLPYRYVSFSLK